MGIIICFFVGILFGLGISYFIVINKYDGEFKVDLSDPEKDTFNLDFSCPIAEIPEKKYVRFRVVVKK